MGMSTDQQVKLLMQGTEYGDPELQSQMAQELRERLEAAHTEGRPLRVYCGFDPRTADLHIGHTVPIRKLRQFQELGHEVIFLVGTYTSTIGDPSDKDRLRQIMTRDQAVANGKTYAEQAFRILDRNRTQVAFNHEWLEKLSFGELIEAASLFSIQQFLTREAFRKRWNQGDAVYLHETFYSIMQAWDARHLNVDIQVGGTDQLFNIMTASRRLMSASGQKPNVALILGILPGTEGSVKMSKSLGNHVPINSTPTDMYGKVMSIPDHAMRSYFSLVSPLAPWEIEAIMTDLERGAHPRDVKMRLAREIVGVFHGENEVARAEADFVRVFQKGQKPERMADFALVAPTPVVDILVTSGLVASRSEVRRLISQRGVRLNDRVLDDHDEVIDGSGLLQVGKRRYLRLVRS